MLEQGVNSIPREYDLRGRATSVMIDTEDRRKFRRPMSEAQRVHFPAKPVAKIPASAEFSSRYHGILAISLIDEVLAKTHLAASYCPSSASNGLRILTFLGFRS